MFDWTVIKETKKSIRMNDAVFFLKMSNQPKTIRFANMLNCLHSWKTGFTLFISAAHFWPDSIILWTL